MSNPEDEVTATAFGDWLVNVDVQARGGQRDSRLSDRSFLIRCHIRQPSDRIGWAVSV
jgi:hypothetical protein